MYTYVWECVNVRYYGVTCNSKVQVLTANALYRGRGGDLHMPDPPKIPLSCVT